MFRSFDNKKLKKALTEIGTYQLFHADNGATMWKQEDLLILSSENRELNKKLIELIENFTEDQSK